MDVDAIRSVLPRLVQLARDEMAPDGSANASSDEGSKATLTMIDTTEAWFEEVRKECGWTVDDIHWIVAAACMHDIWIRRDESNPQMFWSAAVATDGCDWNRILSYCESKGMKWRSGSIYGVPVHTVGWYRSNGYIGYSVSIVPDDGMVHIGVDSRLWEVHHGKRENDTRPSRSGSLSEGEVIRIVFADPFQKPKQFLGNALYLLEPPWPYEPWVQEITECEGSVFLSEEQIGVRLRITFREESFAKEAQRFFQNEQTMQDARSRWRSNLERARRRNEGGSIAIHRALLALWNSPRIEQGGAELVLDTGHLEARRLFRITEDEDGPSEHP